MSNLNSVNIEEKTVNVAAFNQTETALAELKSLFSIVPDCATKEGYAEAKAGKIKLTKYRTKLEIARKKVKGPYKVAGEIIDTEARRIKLALEAIEFPLKAALKVADEAEAKKKADRIARLQAKVDEIYEIEAKAQATEGKDAVSKYIEALNNLDVDNDYYDLTTQAQDAKMFVLHRLGELYVQRLDMEVAELQRVEAEDRRKIAEAESKQVREQQVELERVSELKDRIMRLREKPLDLMDSNSIDINREIDALLAFDMAEVNWEPIQKEAFEAYNTVTERLGKMFRMAKAKEDRAEAEDVKLKALNPWQDKKDIKDILIPANSPVRIEKQFSKAANPCQKKSDLTVPMSSYSNLVKLRNKIKTKEPIINSDDTEFIQWAKRWDIDPECFRQLLEII